MNDFGLPEMSGDLAKLFLAIAQAMIDDMKNVVESVSRLTGPLVEVLGSQFVADIELGLQVHALGLRTDVLRLFDP